MEYPLASRMACSMTRVLTETPLERPLIVPVPLHRRRRRWRGFDQAALLARTVARYTLFGYAEGLERTRDTPQQARTRSRAERMTVLQEAFRTTRPSALANRDVILVDDVCTTGATVAACASALRTAGVASVTALVYARTDRKPARRMRAGSVSTH
jgi:ComF family protein